MTRPARQPGARQGALPPGPPVRMQPAQANGAITPKEPTFVRREDIFLQEKPPDRQNKMTEFDLNKDSTHTFGEYLDDRSNIPCDEEVSDRVKENDSAVPEEEDLVKKVNENGKSVQKEFNFDSSNVFGENVIHKHVEYFESGSKEDGSSDHSVLDDRTIKNDLESRFRLDTCIEEEISKVPLKVEHPLLSHMGSSTSEESVPSLLRPLLRDLPKTQSLDLRHHDEPPPIVKSKNMEPSALTREMRARLLVSQQSRSLGRDDSCDSSGTSGSPGNSPRALRRRPPLRESRRVSIDASGNYLQLNQYKLMEPIGQGSYGIVKLAYNEEDDTHYAMKILSKRRLLRKAGLFGRAPPRRGRPPPDPLDLVRREIAVLKKLDHPNVVKLVEVLDDPLEDHLYLVFELVERGPVMEPNAQPLPEALARRYFRDMLSGIEYLHYQNIIHRDIKPANLLVGEGSRVLVADLGGSSEGSGGGGPGTPAFLAPEAFPCANPAQVTKASDIWSMGVTLYTFVTGAVPWRADGAAALYSLILSQPLVFPPPGRALSPPLRRLLSSMLDKNPATRITLPNIKEDPWVTMDGKWPMPSEEDNCHLVEVTEEDVARVVTSIPKVSTLILIKTMLKKHSFQNPFLSRPGKLSRGARSASAPGAYLGLPERQGSFDSILPALKELTVDPHSTDHTILKQKLSLSSNSQMSMDMEDQQSDTDSQDPALIEDEEEVSQSEDVRKISRGSLSTEMDICSLKMGFKYGGVLGDVARAQETGDGQDKEAR